MLQRQCPRWLGWRLGLKCKNFAKPLVQISIRCGEVTGPQHKRWVISGTLSRPPFVPRLHLSLLPWPCHSATAITMSQTSSEIPSHANYRLIFDRTLQAYRKKTGKDLPTTPLFHTLETCRSSDEVIVILRQQVPAFDQSGSSNDGLTRWLEPTVKVVNVFSATIALVSLAE